MAATATPGVLRSRTRILIASADPAFRKRIMTDPAYADTLNEEAIGGAHALAKLVQFPCDGVLLDRNLPESGCAGGRGGDPQAVSTDF